jgi:hypothetical protein
MSQDRTSQPKYAQRKHSFSLAELATKMLEPVIARRTNMRIELVAHWPDIVGQTYGECSRPEKIKWRRNASMEDEFTPGTLVIACESAHAILLQHETGEIIERINVFFGFCAIDAINIVQKPVRHIGRNHKTTATELPPEARKALDSILAGITDPQLRCKLEKLGKGIFARRRK